MDFAHLVKEFHLVPNASLCLLLQGTDKQKVGFCANDEKSKNETLEAFKVLTECRNNNF